jgi:hypothetical protein
MPKGTLTNDHVLPFTASGYADAGERDRDVFRWDVYHHAGNQRDPDGHGAGNYGGCGVMLHGDGAQAITMHADGTQSVQSIGARAVELGAPSDVVVLQFYASGMRDAGEVRVQIGGEEAGVLYAGAADRFSGLDQVSVQVPRSLAGRGEVEVLLTADGQTAGPVRLQIQ